MAMDQKRTILSRFPCSYMNPCDSTLASEMQVSDAPKEWTWVKETSFAIPVDWNRGEMEALQEHAGTHRTPAVSSQGCMLHSTWKYCSHCILYTGPPSEAEELWFSWWRKNTETWWHQEANITGAGSFLGARAVQFYLVSRLLPISVTSSET